VRLVLDTNVVLSGLLWTGSPMRILAAAQAGEAELFTSRALLAELYRCLGRAKFARQVAISGIGREELFLGYVELAAALAPDPIAPVILADPDDDHVLACALAARAHAIVSGDRHLLALAAFRDIPVLKPADALARISAGQ
jgi:putative PIN family toxin of toxin-antitoxin system